MWESTTGVGELKTVLRSRSRFKCGINLCQDLVCNQWRRSGQVKVSQPHQGSRQHFIALQ